MSCTATPVRSAIVICSSDVRPFASPLMTFQCLVDFAAQQALGNAVGNDQVGACENVATHFLLVVRVRTHCRHMRAREQTAGDDR